MPTFCRKLQIASFYSYLKQPYIKLCHRQNSDKHTYEIIYVRFRRYVCISFVNFLLRKKYIAQLNKPVEYKLNAYMIPGCPLIITKKWNACRERQTGLQDGDVQRWHPAGGGPDWAGWGPAGEEGQGLQTWVENVLHITFPTRFRSSYINVRI